MARMIPPYVAESCLSPGEKILFARFRDDPDTESWTVLHSLDIASHPYRQSGEIDFVAIIPGEGILCLEVKAGRVSRQGGVWEYGRGTHATRSNVGPFRQASDAMHALRKQVSGHDQSLSRILFWTAVVFTLIDFDEDSPEWHSWQSIGRSELSALPLSKCCIRVLEHAHMRMKSTPSCHWYTESDSRPTKELCERVVALLRPDFEYPVSPAQVTKEKESLIYRFTQEQFAALDLVGENRRLMFKGPAGTGKTFLALETCRRSALAKRRTLFVCFNTLLADWLNSQLSSWVDEARSHVVCGTWHQILFQMSGRRPIADPGDEFWTSELPEIVVERLLEGVVKPAQFEALVLDEAQDLSEDSYLDVFDLLLEGGLSGGYWSMFGDYERQAIYRASKDAQLDISAVLSARSLSPVAIALRTNCRNTARIATAIELASHLNPGYQHVLNAVTGDDVEVSFYTSDRDCQRRLGEWCKKLLKRYDPADITVLSAKSDEFCAAGKADTTDVGVELKRLRECPRSNHISYSSIHAFKGLESRAVIVSDIDRMDTPGARALLYVGMSRARLTLVLLMHRRCSSDWNRMLREGLLS